MTDRRFIEEHFPVREVSAESSREKYIRHGHICTLHLWWARRPLAASRATIYASLIPAPESDEEAEMQKREIVQLSRWENSINADIIGRARKRIVAYGENPPKILDPFAGGGSIPLEALRLGCKTYASDYNPVANLIVKATTEYPFRRASNTEKGLQPQTRSSLVADVKRWSGWVMNEAKKDLAKFFPSETASEPVGYLWSRCIPCQNPRCGATVPLLKQMWLANNKNRKITLIPTVRSKGISFNIAGIGKDEIPHGFDPASGTVSRGKATCLVCGHRMDGDRVKALFAQGMNSECMNAVITKTQGRSGKTYSIATKNNTNIFKKAQNELEKKRNALQEYNTDPLPNEPTPEGKGRGAERAFSVRLYGMNTWGDLFNDRQKLVLLTFVEKILEATRIMEKEGPGSGMRALPYLAIILDRLADKNAALCTWNAVGEKIEHVFGRQTLPIVWDYAEVNPFTSVGWPNMEKWVVEVLEHLETIDAAPATVQHMSATALPFSDGFFDAIVTDPPYYDNVPYSHLSDFFYIWMKRAIGSKFPDLFSTPLTPKSDEIVAYSSGPGGYEGGRELFKKTLERSFSEVYRVLKPDGISVIVYAHKSTDGWEALIESLLRSGLVVTAAWPIHTEMKARLRSKKSAALLSSIYMVCRKWEREPIGFYRNVKRDLKRYLDRKLDKLWGEEISGADFFIAAIGSAIEVYGKYDRVIDDQDADVPVLRLLGDTRTLVTNYAIDRVIDGKFADSISQMTRFYVLWRWAHGEAKAPFDEALKLAQSVGINLSQELTGGGGQGFIKKDKEHVRVVGPDERTSDCLDESSEMIDSLHHALNLWQSSKVKEAGKFLSKKGYEHSDALRRVAQAISASLSDTTGSKEKDWIDGMFTGSLGAIRDTAQTKL